LLFETFDEIVAEYAEGARRREVEQARRTFFDRSGKVSDDEPRFEERITAFLEWYALARPLDDLGVTPAVAHARNMPDGPARRCARALATSHWSLFRIVEVTPESVRLLDLVGGARFLAFDRRRTGIEADDVIEARLLWHEGRVLFSRGFCYHPRDARKSIAERVKLALERGEDKEALLLGLARARLRCERYGKNVSTARIYETMEII
jgi:hypothetical protein